MADRAVVRLIAVAALTAALALSAAGCDEDPPALPLACTEGEAPIRKALEAVPGDVRLADGTRLSTCVERARNDAQLSTMGHLLTAVAEDLGIRARDERDPVAARRLGFLAGAVQRGSDRTTGIQAELARRIARSAVKLDDSGPEIQRALVEGTEAGLARG